MNKIKEFFKKWVVHNIGYKIGALVFAFVLWLVIVNINDPTINRTITNIPVNILHEEKVLDGSHVYTIENGETATITVSGNRSIVASLTADDFLAKADFSELSITNAVPITVELTGDAARFSGSVNITVRTTSMIIKLEEMGEKNIPVEGIARGQSPEYLVIDDVSTSPAQVTLRAPKSIIKAAEKAIAYIDAKSVTGDMVIDCPLTLVNSQGDTIEQNNEIVLSTDTVAVHVRTTFVKTVSVSITPIGTPAQGMTCTGITYSKDSISIRGPQDILNGLNQIVLPSELLSLEGKNKDVSITVDITNYLPYGVTANTDSTKITITATIEKIEEETTEN